MATMSPSVEDRSKIDSKHLEMLRVRNQHGKSVLAYWRTCGRGNKKHTLNIDEFALIVSGGQSVTLAAEIVNIILIQQFN